MFRKLILGAAIAAVAISPIAHAQEEEVVRQVLTKQELVDAGHHISEQFGTWLQRAIGSAPYRVNRCKVTGPYRGRCKTVVLGDTQTCKARVVVYVTGDNRLFGYLRNLRCGKPHPVRKPDPAPTRDGDGRSSPPVEQTPVEQAPDEVEDAEADIAEIPPPLPNSDDDAWPDAQDNCPNIYNPSQDDVDADGIGNLCDETPWPEEASESNE